MVVHSQASETFFFAVGLFRAFNMLIFTGTLVGEGRNLVLPVLFGGVAFQPSHNVPPVLTPPRQEHP